ncbi:MAG: AraC family transcriptional regulator [Lachnospiraceae bacterium]|nr:AraC family transcriptional regulator [Lachnospiraceae bacterium]
MNSSYELITPNEGIPFKMFLFEGKDGNYRREKHWHRPIEIFAVCGGELVFWIDDSMRRLKPGDFMIDNSNEIHSIDSPLPNQPIVIQIPLQLFEGYFLNEQFIWFVHEPGEADQEFMEVIREMWRVYCEQEYGSRLMVLSLFYRFMHLLVTEYRMPEVNPAFQRRNKNLDKLSAITSYMQNHYAEDLSLSGVAELFSYSSTHLSRMFQNYAGITFRDYLQSVRLEHALKDLKAGDVSILSAAMQNGFPSGKALSRAFKKKYGMLPGEYREMVRGEQTMKGKS